MQTGLNHFAPESFKAWRSIRILFAATQSKQLRRGIMQLTNFLGRARHSVRAAG